MPQRSPDLSLILAMLLAYWPRAVAGQAMNAMPGGYDNHHPRDQQHAGWQGAPCSGCASERHGSVARVRHRGARRRAAARVDPGAAAVLRAFRSRQLVCVLAYLHDKASLRSGMFGLGMLVCFVLLGSAAFA